LLPFSGFRTMRIATWNVERPTNDTAPRSQRALKKIQEVAADIWILTETHDAICPDSGYYAISTTSVREPPIYHAAGEHMTTIWSRWPIIEQWETATPHRATCAVIETPVGGVVVYGTVIPYHGARWPYGTPRNWDAHYAAIATQGADWSRLRRKYPAHGFCVAGDLNQSRTGRMWYGTKWGRALLDLALKENQLVGVTQVDYVAAQGLSQEDRSLLDQSIDHICLDGHWAGFVQQVGIWPNETADGEHLSDHSGVYADLA
jgi:endonuclease/exonuclease/phosphatase family metal-dependent hydrolase